MNYKPKNERKKVLLLSDDILLPSGVGTVSREIVLGTVGYYNWVQIAGGMNHPNAGKMVDLSESISKESGISDASVTQYPVNGYGDARILRTLLKQEKPDIILHFTDPRQWGWLYDIEHEVRQICPIVYYSIWDNLPIPHWNKDFYHSCDLIMGISKQSHNIHRMVLGDDVNDVKLSYVPHGINSEIFKPLDYNENYIAIDSEYSKLFDKEEYEFIAFYNNRNITRKKTQDVIMGFKKFISGLPEDKKHKVALLMHTDPMDEHGTNLFEVINKIAPECRIILDGRKISPKEMNILYNIVDVTINIANAEGFGLSNAESQMAGTMTIANVTGGLQDQMRFKKGDGTWINFDDEFTSNHKGRYLEHGEWCYPIFPKVRTMVGSIPTPYIFEDLVDYSDLAIALEDIYNTPKDKRNKNGLIGREWMLSSESNMSAENMCGLIVSNIDTLLNEWIPRSRFTMHKYKKNNNKIINGIVDL